MDSKERVLTAFANREPDRVPAGFAGANERIKRLLTDYFGLKSGDDEGLLQNLGVDFRGGWFNYTGPNLHPEIPGRQVDPQWGWRTRYVENKDGGYWDYCDFPLKDADEKMIADWSMPSPDDFDYNLFREMCMRNGRYAVYIGSQGHAL